MAGAKASLLMLISLILACVCATAAQGTISISITKDRETEAQQLRKRSRTLRERSLRARDDTVQTDLSNDVRGGLYFTEITIGTPVQRLALQVDTGSSDVWVPSADSQICESRRGCPNGGFNPDLSTSFEVVGQDEFNISYVDGSSALGDYFLDTFTIGGATLNGFQMGLGQGSARDTSINIGILGIAYNTSVANIHTGDGTTYPNLPVAMVEQGLIPTYAYSLWLNDLESSTGSILFGGIDTQKYEGDLISVDVYPNSITDTFTSFTVAWTSLSATSSSGSDQLTPPDFALPAILDSGTTITLLPVAIAIDIFEVVGASISQALGAIVVPCDLRNNDGFLSYQFGGTGGPTIRVQISDLVLDLATVRGGEVTYSDGTLACQLGIQAASEDIPTLFGDTFLRSAYVVYDIYNNKVALAQTVFNESDSNVVSFESLGASIPSASTAPSQAIVTQTASGIPRVGSTATVRGDAQATYDPTATGFNAASGFQSTATGKKKSAGVRLEPFQWSRVVVGTVSFVIMGLSGSVFAVLCESITV